MYPMILVIDANTQRSQRLGRLLTLTGYRPCLAMRPYDAFERLLQLDVAPQAILLGQPEQLSHPMMQRLLQRCATQFHREIPLLPLPFTFPDSLPLVADASLQTFHRIAQEHFDLLEPVRRVAPLEAGVLRRAQQSLVLTMLPKMGLRPRVSHELRSRNSHFRQVLQVAYELIGFERWSQLITDVGLAQYASNTNWPVDSDERTIPADHYSYLHQAVAFSNPSDPAKQLWHWGERATSLSLQKHMPSALTQQVLRLLPIDRVMGTVLNGITNEMNEIRGEELHFWRKLPDGTYYMVNYSNLYAYGRVLALQPSCHVWTASLERTLRLIGLDSVWQVVEVECSCQTLTGHCLFVVQPR